MIEVPISRSLQTVLARRISYGVRSQVHITEGVSTEGSVVPYTGKEGGFIISGKRGQILRVLGLLRGRPAAKRIF